MRSDLNFLLMRENGFANEEVVVGVVVPQVLLMQRLQVSITTLDIGCDAAVLDTNTHHLDLYIYLANPHAM